jgi:hypothetical protein
MTSIKFEITWEDVQDIAKRRDYILNKKLACRLLSDIESGVRGWFNDTRGDAICDSLTMFLPDKKELKKLAEYKSGKRHKVTIYTITDDISNKHGSMEEHILESYADEAENNAHGCVTREESEEYMTDKELDNWAKLNGAKKELAEWREAQNLATAKD